MLAHERQAYWRLGLQTALKWGRRPLEFFGVEAGPAWTETDRVLAMALELYERSLCAECSQPRELAWDPEMDGWFEVDDSTVCMACAERERWVKEVKEPQPGQKITVRFDAEGYAEANRR